VTARNGDPEFAEPQTICMCCGEPARQLSDRDRARYLRDEADRAERRAGLIETGELPMVENEFVRRRATQRAVEDVGPTLEALASHTGEEPAAFVVGVPDRPVMSRERAREVLAEMHRAHPDGIPAEVANLRDRMMVTAWPELYGPDGLCPIELFGPP
jgi:hypothetical protein